MQMRIAAIALSGLLIAGGCGEEPQVEVLESVPEDTWHTTPDKWDEPRIFHTAFDDQWADRVQLAKEPVRDVNETMYVSPNGAYWYAMEMSEIFEPTQRNATIRIYNERDDFFCIRLADINSSYECRAEWINEKLLYVRFWLGRVLGVDLIVDVETEQIVYQEMVNDGGIPFLQWQQARTEQDT